LKFEPFKAILTPSVQCEFQAIIQVQDGFRLFSSNSYTQNWITQ